VIRGIPSLTLTPSAAFSSCAVAAEKPISSRSERRHRLIARLRKSHKFIGEQMRERPIENERKERNCYGTPQWVTLALIPHLRSIEGTVWDPVEGAGSRTMLQLLTDSGFKVEAPDIAADPRDFLRRSAVSCGAIITNPPHAYAQEFIEHGLRLMRPNDGLVAMLLRTDYDHASSRQYLFGRHKHFAKKLVLTKRIKWFEDTTGQPPFKHAWFIWDWKHCGPPVLAYA
jgi:hypothetical protein